MSKILRRPMFRGGPVDSRGTGITSGLMDKPKRGLVDEPGGYAGEVITGGQIVKRNNPTFFGLEFDEPFLSIPKRSDGVGIDNRGKRPRFLSDVEDMAVGEETDETLIAPKTTTDLETMFGDRSNPEAISQIAPYSKGMEKQMKAEDLAIGEGDDFTTTEELEELKKEGFTSIDDLKNVKQNKKQKSDINNLNQFEKNNPNSNQEQATEIDAKQLMKENAELFKELLGSANKQKLKDARISDASDYLLKFFEGTQREGATVGSAAADVAAFATARDSKTERAKQGIEKQDQTAMALAINDYISGKRSKEQLEMLSKKMDINLENKFAAIDYTAAVADAAKKGKSLTTIIEEGDKGTLLGNIRSGTKIFADAKELNPPRSFISKDIEGSDLNLVSDTNELLVEENKGQIFIDEATKEVFIVVEDPDNPGNFIKSLLYR